MVLLSTTPTLHAATRAAAPMMRAADWNPQGVSIPGAYPEYLKTAPEYLDKTLVGDAGFDPLCLAAYSWPAFMEKGTRLFGERQGFLIFELPDFSVQQRKKVFDELTPEQKQEAVAWMREAELKHSRLAMLAVIGWPLGELANSGFLHAYGDLHGRTPSLFNGGLLENYAPMWFIFLAAASYVELTCAESGRGANGDYELGFDPLGFGNDKDMQLKELKNGRLAMMAITGFAVQEYIWGAPVFEQIPFKMPF